MQTIFNEFTNRKLKTNQNENIVYETAFVEKYMTKLLKTIPLSFCFTHHNFQVFLLIELNNYWSYYQLTAHAFLEATLFFNSASS